MQFSWRRERIAVEVRFAVSFAIIVKGYTYTPNVPRSTALPSYIAPIRLARLNALQYAPGINSAEF